MKTYQVERQEKYSLLTILDEKLTARVAPEVKAELVIMKEEGVRNIIMDMSATQYCDSSGLSAILVANRICKNSNGTFVLCGLQNAVMKLITISQLDSVLNITPTLSEAIDFIFMEEIENELGSED